MDYRLIRFINVFPRAFALVFLFGIFAALVKPQVGQLVIPRVISMSQTYEEQNRGVDLDPIFVPSDISDEVRAAGLYSTRYGYVGEGIYGDLVTSDTRVVAMNHFLIDYGSPMAKYAESFVAAADDSGLDWRLVASISGVESAFGQLIPHNSYNGWGWRGGVGGDFSVFTSWDEGIRFVTSHISEGYGTDMDVFTMEPIYCPPCGANPQHVWANGVSRYMNQLEEYRSNL